jgi:hypothetical protein
MKPVFLLALAAASAVFGQATPEAFLGLVPAIPGNVCGAPSTARDAFREKVEQVVATMDRQLTLKRRQEEAKAQASGEALQDKMMGGKAKRAKFDAAKVERMSDAEKMAFAMAQAGSMDPAAMQQMATRASATRDIGKPSKSIERIREVRAKYHALDQEERSVRGVPGGRDYTARAMNRPDLCPQLSAKYVAILGEHLAAIKAALPDFHRRAEAAAASAGIPKAEAASTEAMAEIKAYTECLRDVYRFNLYRN